MGYLTTHVLDTANGTPAVGLHLKLFRVLEGVPELITKESTNSDGRCDQPIAKDEKFVAGTYQLEFHVGDYFKGKGVTLDDPAFLGIVPVRFGVSSPQEHYHVPLLVTPYSYSTYRGS